MARYRVTMIMERYVDADDEEDAKEYAFEMLSDDTMPEIIVERTDDG